MGVVHYVILLPEGNSVQIVQCRAQATSHAAVLYHLDLTAPCLILVLHTGVEAGLEKP